jgi:geranylgeranyl diphosphate synthase type II
MNRRGIEPAVRKWCILCNAKFVKRYPDSHAAEAGRTVSRDLWDDLRGRQQQVEAALRETLPRFAADAPAALLEAMSYSLFAPGKRIRPLLCLLACEASGGTSQAALPAACALEMVHTYSLIHDDLPAMDDDDLRRGLPTCHKKFGEALAILAGDALLTMAFEVVSAGYPARIAAVSCLELARGAGAAGMVGGQVLDLQAEGEVPPSGISADSLDGLEGIHRRKTGALFRSSLRLGLYAGSAGREDGVDSGRLADADRYASAFGLAFQITDDLLDVEGTAEQLGKRAGKDAAKGKLTYPGLLGIDESRRRAEALGQDAEAAAERLGSPLLKRLAEFVVKRER